MLARERPCLEHMRQLSIWADQPLGHVLSMVSHRQCLSRYAIGTETMLIRYAAYGILR